MKSTSPRNSIFQGEWDKKKYKKIFKKPLDKMVKCFIYNGRKGKRKVLPFGNTKNKYKKKYKKPLDKVEKSFIYIYGKREWGMGRVLVRMAGSHGKIFWRAKLWKGSI